MSRRALTLIELLAVVVILSMAAAIGVVSLSNVDAQARIDRFVDRWRELDDKARLTGMRGSAVVLNRGEDELTLSARDSEPDIIVAAAIPAHISMTFAIDGKTVDRLQFDQRGCSEDYTLAIATAVDILRWTVNGETGWIEPIREGASQ